MPVNNVADGAVEIARIIEDPELIVFTILIVALLLFMFFMFKQFNKRDLCHMGTIKKLTVELHSNSETLAKLTTLIDVLVHGK